MEYELFSTKQNCLAARLICNCNDRLQHRKKVSIPKNILESIERLDTPTYE